MDDYEARVGQLREVAAAQGFWLRRDHPWADRFWLVNRAANTAADMPPGTGVPLDEIERRLADWSRVIEQADPGKSYEQPLETVEYRHHRAH